MNLEKNENPRTVRLIEYLNLLVAKQAGKAEFHLYEGDLQSATPFEVNDALDAVLSQSDDVEGLSGVVSQFIRAVGTSLEAYPQPLYPEQHLLSSLQDENNTLQEAAARMRELSLQIQQGDQSKISSLKDLVASTTLLRSHYVRLQNELFPLFELAEAHHSCVKLMWALQDRALALQKEVSNEHDSLASFWKVFGQFYFHMQILLYRERYILFPVAYRSIEKVKGGEASPGVKEGVQSLFVSPTGTLDFVVLERIFALLPLDIAFIDKDDRVAFYSDPPHRIFPRSPNVIGRLVQNCHPPKSVDTVEKILTTFKEGSEDSAEFYLTIGEKFVHIEYFAVRDVHNSYLGTLEVTQDATHLRSLVGEKRLL